MKVIDNIFLKQVMAMERNDKRFTVVFDMDNTLFDQFGGKQRPGIENALQLMHKKNIKMIVWTNSTRQRAEDIFRKSQISPYFYGLIARESYMAGEIKKLKPDFFKKIEAAFPKEIEFQKKYESGKNISLLGYDILIDDNPQIKAEASFWDNVYDVRVCESFKSGVMLNDPEQIERYAREIVKKAKPGLFSKLFS